jgi:2-methylcitrate dehydratase PrpD
VHPALDGFLRLRDQHGLRADEIEHIRVIGHPYGAHPNSLNTDITNTIDAQFSIPYIFSVAAHGVRVGPEWQDETTMADPAVRAFMSRVSYHVHPAYGRPSSRNPHASPGAVEVVTRGGVLRDDAEVAHGSPVDGFRLTDAALSEKFAHNAARVLPADRVDRVVEAAFALDTLGDAGDLMRHVTPDR